MDAISKTDKKRKEARPELAIATAPSRQTKRWKNQQMSWDDLLQRFQTPTRTQVSYAEYRAMPKAQQGAVKDVGGFVLGALSDGRRMKGAVTFRTGLSLDLDTLPEGLDGFWETVTMFTSYECVLYSTHSHGPKHERGRLIIPLARPVTADEYEAVARKVADELDIKAFDPTTFEPERFMYWPSATRDGDFVFRHQESAWLDPDRVLASYVDWRDTSFWPGLDQFHERHVGQQMRRQEDPLEKKGVIGAYCREYSIEDVLEGPLKDVYVATADPRRWTFTGGSTTGGMVIYDDKFAYSHHATDPISGQLVNAFDLVRIHKFGGLDDAADEGAKVTGLPSYQRMTEFALEDAAVKLRSIREKDKTIEEGLEFEEGDDWLQALDVNAKGVVQSTVKNCRTVLTHHPELKGRYRFDAFANRAIVTDELPWQDGKERDWNDIDDAGFRELLEKQFGVTGVQKIMDGITLAFEAAKVHPVREYLERLTWDGKARVSRLLVDYFGAADTPYTRAVTEIHLTAAVARVMRPGVKYDTMLTLIGPQGIGKSTFIRLLCGEAWFNDSIERIQGKETFELLQGAWHVELGELNATKKAEKEAVKQFLSKTVDIYRAPYGRRTNRYPRQCVFWGTGNEPEFLRDETGERRYFPVTCCAGGKAKSVFKDLPGERDQIWAEAVALWKRGRTLYLSPEEEKLAQEVRQQHKEDRPKVGMVQAFLDKPIPVDWYDRTLQEKLQWLRGADEDELLFGETETMRRDKTCVAEVWCELFEMKFGAIKPIESKEIGNILRDIPGWKTATKRRFGEYGPQLTYVREGGTEDDLPFQE